jgi:hypothetical protein
MSYISGELKSARERYILVEATDIVIKAGVWNIYTAKGVRIDTLLRCKTKDIQD